MAHKLNLKTKVDFYWKQTTKKINGENRKVWVRKVSVFPKNSSVGKLVYRYKVVGSRR